jgi:hypothetical protein
MARSPVLLSLAVLAAAVLVASAGTHKFRTHDDVPLWANKVGPFHNPR